MKYILAKTIGKVEIGVDGYPTGELRLENSPSKIVNGKKVSVDWEWKCCSPDQSQMLIKVLDDTIDVTQFGQELTVLEAKAKFDEWQNWYDANCVCLGKSNTHATHPELNKPCLASNLGGVCHEIIDKSKPEDTKEYDKWKKDFDKKSKIDFEDKAKERIKKRKENEILDVVVKIKSDPLTVKSQLDSITVTKAEIDAEIPKIQSEEDDRAKYRYVKHPLKKVKVAF